MFCSLNSLSLMSKTVKSQPKILSLTLATLHLLQSLFLSSQMSNYCCHPLLSILHNSRAMLTPLPNTPCHHCQSSLNFFIHLFSYNSWTPCQLLHPFYGLLNCLISLGIQSFILSVHMLFICISYCSFL